MQISLSVPHPPDSIPPSPSLSQGVDIRVLRKSRGLTLQALAQVLGRSVGWLSQVERGVTAPAIRDLQHIAEIFDISVSFFFRNASAPSHEQGTVVRASARSPLGNTEGGLIEHMLSPDLGGDHEMIHCCFLPGASSSWRHRPTEESGYLISGALELWIEQHCHALSAGDSFRFKHQRFRWANNTDRPCEVIWVVAPPVY